MEVGSQLSGVGTVEGVSVEQAVLSEEIVSTVEKTVIVAQPAINSPKEGVTSLEEHHSNPISLTQNREKLDGLLKNNADAASFLYYADENVLSDIAAFIDDSRAASVESKLVQGSWKELFSLSIPRQDLSNIMIGLFAQGKIDGDSLATAMIFQRAMQVPGCQILELNADNLDSQKGAEWQQQTGRFRDQWLEEAAKVKPNQRYFISFPENSVSKEEKNAFNEFMFKRMPTLMFGSKNYLTTSFQLASQLTHKDLSMVLGWSTRDDMIKRLLEDKHDIGIFRMNDDFSVHGLKDTSVVAFLHDLFHLTARGMNDPKLYKQLLLHSSQFENMLKNFRPEDYIARFLNIFIDRCVDGLYMFHIQDITELEPAINSEYQRITKQLGGTESEKEKLKGFFHELGIEIKS